ncbi:hypothetical protein FAES_5088 [Fibrella aestuarina BUZ 2]|uniref:Late embryogenesis abundant protein LEA-2 subgroup domain-containing protein n=1 Tax=Fibrella aestuarina BUZ 2 TaxID=1166018 RepID=I0KG34_9BACT|nr:hypothetical protein [Fibrella aestuarina]CCH03087.1 hypothetical protein FAES_5088 [Fibrella aestuarina BUZ 2]
MRLSFKLALLATPLLFAQCGINRQVQQAKMLGKSQYAVRSADSITIAGYDVREFKDIRQLDDINPLKYPRVAAGLLSRNVPFRANINLEIVNPTNDIAAINQFEYRLLLAGNELATGTVQQRVEVPPGGGKVIVPIPVNANAYELVTNASTRNAFVDLVRNLAGSNQVSASRVTLKIKPTLMLGNKQVKYPGYIDIDKEVTRDMLLTAQKPNP